MKPERQELTINLFKTIFFEVLRGKSLSRVLSDYALSQFEVSGDILDLGSGSDSPSYARFLKYKEPYKITYTDYYESGKNLLSINLEEPFEFEQNRFDYVTCFRVLEHIYNYRNVIRESYRILRKGGAFFGITPFMHCFHPDPYDYFRYSYQALLKVFEEEGFVCERMISLGFGPFTLAACQWVNLLPSVLRPVPIFFNISLDLILSIFSRTPAEIYAFNYVFVFRKG